MKKQPTKKHYLIDTSVLISSPKNLKDIYQNGENAVYISDIILEELDNHKENSGYEAAYHARTLARFIESGLEQSKDKEDLLPDDIKAKDSDFMTVLPVLIDKTLIPLIVIRRDNYSSRSKTNDLKIAEVAEVYALHLLTNDLILRVEAISRGLLSSSIKKDSVDSPEEIKFAYTVTAKTDTAEDITLAQSELLKQETVYDGNQITVNFANSNKQEHYMVNGDKLTRVDLEETMKLYKLPPMNVEQKFYALLLSDRRTHIITCTGSTGSGKTLLAVQEGIRRVKDKSSPIDSIIYLRNTVTSNDKESELGFRKGDQDQKLGYFAYPLMGALKLIAKKMQINGSKKNKTGEDNENAGADTLMERFNIEVIDVAHARGTTISNAYIIFDELQNSSNDTLKLIGTRVGEGSVLCCLGDYGQVDHPNLSKNRNALVTLLKLAKEGKSIKAIQLRKTIRSKTANWFQTNI